MKYFAKFIMWLGGWKYIGPLPEEKKAIVISVPHTSTWDFVWGELAFMSQGIPASILMKKEFFFFPLGMILRALHVIPVDRGKKDNQMVDQMVDEFNRRETMFLCITPEGSRKKRKKWKKGFLVIARAAGVPVYLGRIDYKHKTCEFGPIFHPTDDVEADLSYIMSTYKDANPRHPECFSWGEE
ncbi:1-acyl-sn-glycerol-3-phosphate acyltransferase [Odoribacter sp. OttesenSCG-928-J03]|nr:1-acyl-sn-glycerol-3-phosphate acyltransferase [Odoribacter sp. OttesenSCG-928-J03]MDL2283254.1 1-acyl-sn-glycerol-3-phosphate acyltransferase [Odoribacter sp. OttesenSCG-928-G04]MDL2330587.1 1-acyl-sn-glycerol-3-phosphate acyltransferase [Odoribacter sp. OttesenSCG-928-A06]